MRSEDRIIRALARFDPGREEIEGLLQAGDLDWEYIKDTSLSEGVGPLLLYSLEKLGLAELAPPPVREAWEKESRANQAFAIVWEEELKGLLKKFNEAGIEVIVFKGARLSGELYPQLSLRAMDDIDLLVRKREVESAIDVLGRAGYRYFHSPRFVEGEGIEQGFQKEGLMGAFVDLHYDLLPPGRQKVDTEGIWERSQEVTLAGERARFMSPEDEIIYHCARLGTVDKLGSRLIHFVDLREFVEKFRGKIDWGEIIERSGEQRLSKPVYVVLSLLQKWHETNVSAWVLKSLRPGIIRRAMFRILFNPKTLKPNSGRLRIKGMIIGLLLIERYREWVSYLVKQASGSRSLIPPRRDSLREMDVKGKH